jgi:chromosome segregation ATPase
VEQHTLAILGIATGLLSIAGAFISVGREKQARVDLDRRHGELAKEARDAIQELKNEKSRNADKLAELERDQTAIKTRYEEIRSRLEDVKREKASVEAVNALRESVGRVEGTMMEVARRLDMIAQEIMKHHDRDRDRKS